MNSLFVINEANEPIEWVPVIRNGEMWFVNKADPLHMCLTVNGLTPIDILKLDENGKRDT